MSEQPAASPPTEEEYIWTTGLSNECLDDVVLPPGGGSKRKPEGVPSEKLRYIPLPEYLTHEGRDLRIDLIRGYFVFAMVVDHVRGNSPLYLITGGNRFYTSAAEGFILTSGLVAGLVYRRLIKRDGMAPTLLKIFSRSITLYLLTIALTLMFTLFSELLYLPWAQGVNLSDPLGWVISVFTLHRTYYLVDVMLLYTVLFLISPLAFVLLERGKTWALLLGSGVLYLLYQFYPQFASLPWNIDGNYLFNFSAWQVLFFFGLALGFNNERIPSLGCRTTRIGLAVTGVLTAALIAAFFIIDTPTSSMPPEIAITSSVAGNVRLWLQDNLFAKVDVRPGRLFTSAVVFSFLFFAVTQYWRVVRKVIGWLLLPLGQYALYGYTAHIAVVGLVALAISPLKLPSPGPQGLNALIQAASVLLIWFLAKNQWITPTPKTRRFWNASPAAMGVLIVILLWRFPAPTHPGNVAAAAALNSAGARVPSRYGTPVPKGVVVNPAAMQATPQPGAASADSSAAASAANSSASTSADTSEHPVTNPVTGWLESPYLLPLAGKAQERWFYSPELDRDMPYYIYLPPDYEKDARRYPVLFMLHGLGGHREEWIVYGLFNTADTEISNGHLPPMIIVLPQGDKGYWVNHVNEGPLWGEYVWRDLVGHIDFTYRTLRSPHSRAIGGLSMGGFGALSHAFTHPEVFGIAGAHSPSLRPDDGTLSFMGTGEEFASKDPVSLAGTAPNLDGLQIWIDLGQTDEWLGRAELLHQNLSSRGLLHIYQEFPGGHDFYYWNGHILDYLGFYGQAFESK